MILPTRLRECASGPICPWSPSVSCMRALMLSAFLLLQSGQTMVANERPNILVAISDDQSYPHASAYGEPVIQAPAFDQVARNGVLFHNAFTPAPGCSPMRAAFLTGRYIWQIGAAGTHASYFPKTLTPFPLLLEEAGYHVGYTGKPWGPGDFKISGWDRNPAGPAFNQTKNATPEGISATDYAANFEAFLTQLEGDQPFCFWFGGHEPHRSFKKGIGSESGMQADAVRVPSFLPDSDEVRSDILDYFYEIQWFDQHLGRMLKTLESRGMLENTLVIVTSDNGMSFPRAKANVYEYGIHMPLAISWPERYRKGVSIDDVVNLIDVTATVFDASGIGIPDTVSGKSLGNLLSTTAENRTDSDKARQFTLSGRERHSSSRFNSLGYPQRCVRTSEFLYIRNYTPERWPAGAPQKYLQATYINGNLEPARFVLDREHGGYHDIDACPTLDFMVAHRDSASVAPLFRAAVGLRPAEEFYQINSDPGCLNDLSQHAEFAAELERHRALLSSELKRTGDLRELDFARSHVWETYPRYSRLRWFPVPAWASQNPASLPSQEWLEERRPIEEH